ncbi:helix-turn-helix domain-containing protein [Paenibacillus roseipurpureus]|uniref:AraC family transcriptional regulator n=1 Tax=Paenibacillus roseopurpureus TaxID=2918901 RepID=A0AA96RH80_9BACL|nr:AraC family transcriptional regulator [Paenibacillus sp. MBLB1832]WNR43038.1 AraC family transcriptional regulator [Paenibacillus sp. MBLB1832]
MILVPLLLAFLSYKQYSGVLETQISDYNLSMLQQTEKVMDEHFGNVEQQVLGLTQEPLVQRLLNTPTEMDNQDKYNLSQLIALLNRVKAKDIYVKGIYIYFNRSDMVVTDSSKFNPPDFFETAKLQSGGDYQQWKTMMGEHHKLDYIHEQQISSSVSANEKVIGLLQSVSSKNSQDAFATIVIWIGASDVDKLLDTAFKRNQAAVYLFDNQNQILLYYGDEKIRSALPLENVLPLRTDRIRLTGAGKEFIVSRVSDELKKRSIVSVVPTEFIERDLRGTRNTFIWLSLGMITLSMLIAYLLAYISYLPVKRLMGKLQKRMTGQPDLYATKNEFDMIAFAAESAWAEKDKMSTILKSQAPNIRNQLLIQFLKGNVAWEDLSPQTLETVDVKFPHPYFLFILVHIDQFHKDSLAEKTFSKFVIGNILEHLGQYGDTAYVIDLDLEKIGVIYNIKSDQLDIRSLHSSIQEGITFIKNKFNNDVSIALGSIHEGTDGAVFSYNEALKAMEYRLIKGSNTVISYQDTLVEFNPSKYMYPLEIEMSLVSAIQHGDIKRTERLLDTVFELNLAQDKMPLDLARCLFFDLMCTAIKVLNETVASYQEVFESDRNPYDDLLACQTIRAMQETVRNIFQKLSLHMNEKRTSRSDSLKDRMLHYLKQNYHDPNMSLATMASYMNMNPTYLSNLIKEQVGRNFIELVNEFRVDEVKRLLINGDMTLQEIAQKVGYSNSVVLSRNFKKIEYTTPGEYRQFNRT